MISLSKYSELLLNVLLVTVLKSITQSIECQITHDKNFVLEPARDIMYQDFALLSFTATSIVECAEHCAADDLCMTLTFDPVSRSCRGHRAKN